MAREQQKFEPFGYYGGILESAAGDGKGVTADLLAGIPADDPQPTKWSTDVDAASFATYRKQEQEVASKARNIASVFLNMPDNANLVFNRDPYSVMSPTQKTTFDRITKDSGLSTLQLRQALRDRAMEIATARPDAGDRPVRPSSLQYGLQTLRDLPGVIQSGLA